MTLSDNDYTGSPGLRRGVSYLQCGWAATQAPPSARALAMAGPLALMSSALARARVKSSSSAHTRTTKQPHTETHKHK